MNRHKDLCWGTSKAVTRSFDAPSRQRRFHRAFRVQLDALKSQYGNGAYSFAEGVTRKAVRNIARKQAREAING